jgi:predicted nucleic acid-binding protein
MKCLDTDLLVGILRGKAEAQRKMDDLDLHGKCGTTSVNAFELFYGAFRSKEERENVEETKRLLDRLEVFPFETNASAEAGQSLASLAKRGEAIDYRDAMVAAIAKINGLTLVTRNRGHFSRIRGLQLESW